MTLFYDDKEPYSKTWKRRLILATSEEILRQVTENKDDIKVIKDNHLVSIYKTLNQMKGTLMILVPLTLAVLSITILILKNGG